MAARWAARGGTLILAGAGGFAAVNGTLAAANDGPAPAWLHGTVPSRDEQLRRLRQGTAASPYDVLIIGGGATGTGCAADAATRGLKTALIEREDWAAGTSSRSTKLVHGGVRYLEKAFKNLDYGQFKLVFEALHERNVLLRNAPYLSSSLPIMTPCYNWWEPPYFWAGLRMYDVIAGSQGLEWCRYLTPSQALSRFPTLCSHRRDGKSLKGAIMYHDGQFNDSRLAVVLACTAALAGATTINHAEAVRLLKDSEGRVIGAVVRDNLTGKQVNVYARAVINAAGPFVDEVRQLSQPAAPKMIMPSAGVHVTLPDYYSPENVGMIVPKTKDGRVVFMLPWLDQTIAGTTDSDTTVTMRPQPTEDEIQFILDAIADYLTVKVRRSDVQSAWSGIRPLALDPNAEDTASASRDHIVTVDPDGMITVTGGKWTTYRLMAQDALDRAVREANLRTGQPCSTATLKLVGSEGFYPALFTEIAQNYIVPHRPGAIDTNVAKYLVASYGDRASEITHIAEQRKLGRRIVRGYPILEAEVVYAVHNEYCETPEDFIARRTRLAFLDRLACEQALPRVVELMAVEKGWNRWRARKELARALDFLQTFDAPPPAAPAAAAAPAN
ncbi:glycerol-3-phosphate dehydrogenase mitochondrial-like [Micractinium conductrix]|uniref:Glycerol-3-phosphate dehydrogenase n=1 Tax=Micractinium conductrix TaxID=554055 RepID=A0A2P6VD46_9CHLO|nr:glycerol-3-phosphate dehydrogenase mitochondrial-like [Micractinium conductrix]|eukprot:PSC72023.1 glycerol-3-phosphate dehydrogenase mitochondrial-like [Micractinium conductrix]